MKRKFTLLFLILALMLNLTACGGGATAAGMAMCPINMTPEKETRYPYMGVSLKLPDTLHGAVLDNTVFMRADEDMEYLNFGSSGSVNANWVPSPENMILHSGYIEFLYLPEGMRDRVPYRGAKELLSPEEFQEWITLGQPIARLGIYRTADFQESMLEESPYTEHTFLGENTQYLYYLSTNEAPSGANQVASSLFATVGALKDGITLFEPRAMDEAYYGIITPEAASVSSIGTFQATTLDGSAVDQAIFSQANLTMVNVWTTWCGACVEEMPDLEALSQEAAKDGVQIVGIVYDTLNPKGEIDQELTALAKTIVERTGVSYPMLIPDEDLRNGLLSGIIGYPTTWFVDENGNVIGDSILGSHSKEEWAALIQERLAEVSK